MSTITIPKTFVQKDNLVIIPQKEYLELLSLKKMGEFIPTKSQKQALERAERNLQKGKTLSYHELIKKLGFRN